MNQKTKGVSLNILYVAFIGLFIVSLWNDGKKRNWKDENGKEKKRKDTDRIMKKEV